MQILNGLFGTHLGDLQRALGKTTERHGVLGENLANVNTPGYKRRDVEFNIELESQLRKPGSRLAELRQERENRLGRNTSLRLDGNNVDMEREVAALAETELRYQALTDLTADYFRGLKNAIREGR